MAVFGADFDTLQVPETPIDLSLRLVAKLVLGRDEPSSGHSVELQVEVPGGERKRMNAGPMPVTFGRRDPENAIGLEPTSHAIVPLTVKLLCPGAYVFHVIANGGNSVSIPLLVGLARGEVEYPSFVKSDDDKRLFRETIERLPSEAELELIATPRTKQLLAELTKK